MAIFKLACLNNPEMKVCLKPDCPSEIITGEHAGKLLSEYMREAGWNIAGQKALAFSGFPFMISWITPEKAELFSPFKEKFWMILNDTDKGHIYIGAKNPIPLDWENNDEIIRDLHEIKPFYQEFFNIEPGTLAAVGAGTSVLNVEQEANLADTKVQLEPTAKVRRRTLKVDDGNATSYELLSSDNFCIYKTRVDGKVNFSCDDASFGALVMIEGRAIAAHDDQSLHVNTGDTVFVEAGTYDVSVTGNCTFVFVKL